MDNNKGQKMIAALYLVTKHLSDNDPIRAALREYAIGLVESDGEERALIAQSIDTVLGGAVLAGLISEQNASIIVLELRRYASPAYLGGDSVASLFSVPTLPSDPVIKRTNQQPIVPKVAPSQTIPVSRPIAQPPRPSQQIQETKGKRQEQILSFIDERKSVGIKDIVSLFPEVSEKTIQRELGVLVANGQITKRGEKRWSVYLSIK